MNHDRLRQLLDSLHRKLGDAKSVDAETRRQMSALIKDLERVLETSPTTGQDQRLQDRLEELLLRFEAKHPAIATSMHELIDVLAKAGI
jgi:phosphoserine phosphatase